MSRKKKSEFQNFLEQKGYFFVFTLVSAVCLFSYFFVNSNFAKNNEKNVLGTSSIRGIWVRGVDNGCPEARLIDAKGCISRSYFDDYEILSSEEIALDRDGRLVFSNDSLFVSGIFDVNEVIDDEVWDSLYVGDLNLRINNKQWVFQNVVWDKERSSSILSIVQIDSGYLVTFHPSVTLTGRTKQFWVFEYLAKEDRVDELYFDMDGKRAFVEATFGSFISKNGGIFLRLDREDPVLLEGREVMLFEFDDSLRFIKNFVLRSA
jgi:hypothetical protein